MKMRFSLIILTMLLTLSCNDAPKKVVNPVKSESKASEGNSNTIVLNSNDLMKFDKNMLLVTSGKKITLTLNHTGKLEKAIMGHNFVLLKQGVDVVAYAEKAVLARENEYIPEGDEEIVYTKLLGGGESDTITFDAPAKGHYTFICSFPGHYGLMKGKLIVG